MATTGILFGLGDGMAQFLFPVYNENGETEYNKQRTLRAMTFGFFIHAPINVKYSIKTLPKLRNPMIDKYRSIWSAKKIHFFDSLFRVTIDQLFVPGLMWIPLYNISMCHLAMHENPMELAMDKLRNNWWTVLKASWTVWPAFQMFNLMFVPVHLRIFCANIWSVGWNCFLSFIHNTLGHGKGSGHKIEELVDIQDEEQEITMVYS